jgi:diaminohydroxyphosphoribosylaminopyrimidine deaminase / 5-amino-6-(5-phosphoribosylamino)uracil reductase
VRTDVAMIAHINLPGLDNSSLHSTGYVSRESADSQNEVCARHPAKGTQLRRGGDQWQDLTRASSAPQSSEGGNVSDTPEDEVQLLNWMRLSIEMARKSKTEDNRSSVAPNVGVVIVKDGAILGESFRGRTGEGEHAEYGLLKELEGVDLKGAIVFTTLEPCSRRGPGKSPCAEWLVGRGISTVYIGRYDPNPKIYREGWRLLRDRGMALRDYPSGLRKELDELNAAFVGRYRAAEGPVGTATFDHEQYGGRYSIYDGPEHAVEFVTAWTARGSNSIYAVDHSNNVALARYAKEFSEIDDPGALDFGNYAVAVNEGEIAVFRAQGHHVLVRVEKVFAGPERGADRTELQISFEVRMAL